MKAPDSATVSSDLTVSWSSSPEKRKAVVLRMLSYIGWYFADLSSKNQQGKFFHITSHFSKLELSTFD